MREFLRAVRVGIRAGLWIVKGVLLLMAVGVLVLWPMSCRRSIGAGAGQMNAGPKLMDNHYVVAMCQNGRIVIGDVLVRGPTGIIFSIGQLKVRTQGPGWRWFTSVSAQAEDEYLAYSFGPLRWDWHDTAGPLLFVGQRFISVPIWLVAPTLALWPLISLALLIRRRRKCRQRERIRCCAKSGYDLRATLDQCPECGALPENDDQ